MTSAELPNSGEQFAIETRAETLNVRTGGNATRRGEIHEVHAGRVESLEDVVYREEEATIADRLVETADGGTVHSADTLEFTVNGRLAVSAVGWPENKLSGEDVILLGGALADTWTGGVLIAAAVSDDLIIGGGVRVTAPVDVAVNSLTGIQERPGTAQADVVFREAYGTLFEREYAAGTHTASVARFTGSVYQTQRTGFRALMKTALGVRNLIPAAAPEVAPEPSPPSPPPEPGSGATGAGAMVATNVGAGAAGSARSVDNFQDMGRVAGAAEDMENAASLHRAEDTAGTLDELTATARLGDGDAPETVTPGPSTNAAQRPEVDNPYGRIGDLDDPSRPIDDIDEPIPELMGLDFNGQVDAGRLDGSEMTDIVQPGFEGQIDLSARLDDVDIGFDTEFNHDLSRSLGDSEDLVEPGVADSFRLDDSGETNTPALETSDVRVASAQPSLDDSGAGWSVVGDSGGTSPDAMDSAPANYQTMPSRESGVSPGSGTSSGEAQMVADASFERRVPDDFDCLASQAELDGVYHQHREASNWRALEAYGVVNDLRGDLKIMVQDLGGTVGDGDLERLYSQIQTFRSQAIADGNVSQARKIERFIDWYDLKVYDTMVGLAGRADEFESALTGVGTPQLLDPDIDKAKLKQWLADRRDAALARLDNTAVLNDSQIETLGREFPYYQQLWLAIEEGRDPILESLDEISYLRSVNNVDQVDEYMKYHTEFLAILRDPAFRVGAPATVDPTDLLRPGLESTDAALPVVGDDLRTTVLNAEASEPNIGSSLGATGEAATGDFGANREALEGLIGAQDLARPPANQPHWMASVPLRRILFPTGDPGFEHLLEGSLATGSISDVVESTKTGVEAEATSNRQNISDAVGPNPRFGTLEHSPRPRFGTPRDWRPGVEVGDWSPV